MVNLLIAAIIFIGLFTVINPAFAQTWTQTSAPVTNWISIAPSADGAKLAALARGGGVWTSTNSGFTWVSNSLPGTNWANIASSADGNKLAAVAYPDIGPVYTSADSGATWTSNSSVVASWRSVASSADGNKLVAVSLSKTGNGGVWTSTNAGTSWVSNNVPGDFHSFAFVVSSADGTKLMVGSNGGPLFTSTNSGIIWQSNLPNADWAGLASSADGSRLIATIYSTYVPTKIYMSTNSGTTWTNSQISNTQWGGVASSADGSKLVVLGGFQDYRSTSFGISWSAINVPGHTVVSSADGNKLATIGSGISVSSSAPTPRLKFAQSSGNLAISWLVPSTNLVLQQNSELSTSNWLTITNTPLLNFTNLHDEVILPLSNGNDFYRLATP